MYVEIETTITSKVDLSDFSVEHSVSIEGDEAVRVLGVDGLMAAAQGGIKSAYLTVVENEKKPTIVEVQD